MGPSFLHPPRSRLAWAIALALPLAPALRAAQPFDDFYVEIQGPEAMDASLQAPASVPFAAPAGAVGQSAAGQQQTLGRPADKARVYGPVRRGQTLWAVANELRPDRSVSAYQTMLALYRKNPGAFAPGQMNNLYMGTFLRVPTLAEIQAEDEGLARQSARSGRPVLSERQRVPAEPPITAENAAEPGSAEVSAAKPRLKLTPEAGAVASSQVAAAASQPGGEIISGRISIPGEGAAGGEPPGSEPTVAATTSQPELTELPAMADPVAPPTAEPLARVTELGASDALPAAPAMTAVAVSGASATPAVVNQASASAELARLAESNAQLTQQLQQLSREFAQLKGQLARQPLPDSPAADAAPAWAAALASPLGAGVLLGLPALLLLGLGLLWQRLRRLQADQPWLTVPPTPPADSMPTGIAPGLFAEPANQAAAFAHAPMLRTAVAEPGVLTGTREWEPLLTEPGAGAGSPATAEAGVPPLVTPVFGKDAEPERPMDLPAPAQAASRGSDSAGSGPDERPEPVLQPVAELDLSAAGPAELAAEIHPGWQSRASTAQGPLEFEMFDVLDMNTEPADHEPQTSDATEAAVNPDAQAGTGAGSFAAVDADLEPAVIRAMPSGSVSAQPEADGFLDIDILLAQADASPEQPDGPVLAANPGELPGFEGLELEKTEPNNFGSEMDLARAYLEIDDRESARELLTQVLSQGSNKQKAEAQKLLKRLQ